MPRPTHSRFAFHILEPRTLLSQSSPADITFSPSPVTATISKDTLPASVISGGSVKGTVSVALDNTGSADTTATVSLFASLNGANTLLGTTEKPVSVKAGKNANATIQIKSLPSSLDGTYTLFAQVTDASGNTGSSSATGTLTAAAPFVALSESVTTTLPSSLASGAATKATVTVLLTNSGNTATSGLTTISVTASPTAGVAGTALTASPFSKKLIIKPNSPKPTKVIIPLKALPTLADGTYSIVAQTTDSAGDITLATAPTALTVSAGSSSGTGFTASLSAGKPATGATLTLTPGADEKTALSLTYGFSTDAAGLNPAGASTPSSPIPDVDLQAGKPYKIKADYWSTIAASLDPGTYYLTLKVTDTQGHSVTAVSPTPFKI